MKLELVIAQDKMPWYLKKAEGIVYSRNDREGHFKSNGLMFGCPRCAHVATSTHVFNEKTMTLSPSIVCNRCGYHGHLTNGVFENI